MADKRMSIVFDASMNIAQVKSAVSEIQKAFSGVTMPQSIGNAFSKTLDNLTREIANFEQRASKGLENASDFSALSRSGQKIVSLYDDLQASIRRLGTVSDKELSKLFPPNLVKSIESATKAMNEYEAAVKKSQKDIDSQSAAIAKQEQALDSLRQKLSAIQSKNVVSPADFKQMQKDLRDAEQELSDYQTKLAQTEQAAQAMAAKLKAPTKSSKYRALMQEIDDLRQKMDGARDKVIQLNDTVNNTTTFAKQKTDLDNVNQSITEAETKLQEMTETLNRLQAQGDTKALDNLRTALSNIEGIDLSKFPNTIDSMRQAIASLDARGLEQLKAGFEQLNGAVQGGAPAMSEFANRNREAADSIDEFNRKSRDVEALKSRIQYFFGMSNAINLLRRTITSALNTVKELDKAMTATAVVTDFSVGDMWDALPRYTETANKLGTTTLGAYETMTLFYQQGLKTNQVFEVGTETMKMARIAGMDYADATNMMTAALRGFNMEINETSAQRVNDVYSKLAAITASNTQEISTAMTKTASIANSANMQFETTAAFLSQIIETTRESAETAGTAMKTVVARFQELKKDPASIELVDGEAVDANKIETALKSIGVALRDTQGQFRNLDDVFLEIAERWNSLSTNQQRYIATMAAGSRQQSRFIAMMSDYDRTMQLIEAANNSAGASQAQFEKTTESLESKLNKLANAWDAFTMGLANSTVIKGVVDLLTALITGINKLTDALPGPASGFGKLAIAILGLKAGAALFDSFFLNLKNMGTPVKALGATFTQTFTKLISMLSKIKALGTKAFWVGKIDTKPLNDLTSAYADYAKKKAAAEAMAKSGTWDPAVYQQATASLMALRVAEEAAGMSAAELNAMNSAGLTILEQSAILNNADAAAKAKEIIANTALTEAEKQEALAKLAANTQTKLGIFTSMKYGLMLLFGGQAARTAAIQALGLATAEQIATGATHGFTAALLACPIGWIAAGLIAITALVYLLWKAFEAGDPHKQLQKAEDAAKEAAEAVDQARDSVNNLKSSLDELRDSYSTLDDMRRGTDEWREAVVATNNQVLDLIKNYKELAPYVTNKDGVLRLEVGSPEVQGVIAQRQNELLLAQSMQAIANAKVEQAERRADYADLSNDAKVKEVHYYETTGTYEGGNYSKNEITKADYEYKQLLARAGEFSGSLSKETTSSRDLTESLAKAIARGQVRDTGEGVAAAIQDWLIKSDRFDESVYGPDYLPDLAEALADDYDLLREFGNGLIASIAAEETYYDSIVNNAKGYGKLEELSQGSLINSLDSAMFASRLDNMITAETAAIKGKADKNGLAVEDLDEFVELSQGKYKRDGRKIVDAETGEKVEGLDDTAIATQLAAARATEALSAQLVDLNAVFNNIAQTAGNAKAEDLAAMLSTNGEDITRQMINSYIDMFSSDVIDWDKISREFGFENMEKMAESFGMSIEDMAQLIGSNFANATSELNNRRGKIVGMVKKANKSVGKSYETIATELQGLEDKFDQIGLDFYGIFDNVTRALNMSESDRVIDLGTSELWKMANDDSNSAQMIKDLQSFINDIDWSNPIEAMYSLNKEIANGSGLTQEYARKMKTLEGSAFSASNQLKHMITSLEFEDAQEDIDELIAANGKLSAMDVYDLAGSYKTLDKFMKNTGVTANGLAKALTLVSQGKIGINQLTNAVLAALSNFDTLDGVVTKVLRTLEDFDPGADENDVAGFIKDVYEELNENIEKGAVGNNHIFSYYDLLLGEGWRQKTDEDGNLIGLRGDELVEQERYIIEKLRQNAEDMRQSWADLAAGKDFYGNDIAEGSLGNLSIVDTGQRIDLSGYTGMTTDQILDTLMEAYNVSRTYAEMMLADFKNYSADLAAELDENDYIAAVKAMYENANYIYRNFQLGNNGRGLMGATIIDEGEIRAAAEALGKSYEQLKADLEAKGALITHFYDEDGFLRDTSELVAEAKRVLLADSDYTTESARWWGNFLDIGKSTVGEGINVLDYDRMQQIMASLNIPEDAWMSTANAFVNEIKKDLGSGSTVTLDYTLSDGSKTEIEITPNIDLATAIHNAEVELQNAQLAQAIADAFGDVNVSVGLDDGSLQAVTTTITTEIGGEPYTITVTTDQSNLDEVKTAIVNAAASANAVADVSANTTPLVNAVNNLNLTKSVTVNFVAGDTSALNPTSRTVTIPGHATGIYKAPRAHDALVAEEGPELIQKKNGGAYIAQRPQLAHIEKGDTVYTAEQTQEILNTNPVAAHEIPRYKDGTSTGYNAKWWYDKEGGGDGTGNNNVINSNNTVNINDKSVEDEPDLWENPYDWLYNLTEKINENLRVRNNLETKFQILQKRGRTSAAITAKYYDEQFRLMEETYNLQEEMFNKRKYQMQKYMNENQDMRKYGYFDMENMRIVIDWDLINSFDKTENVEEGERIEEYISKLEEIQEQIEDAEAAMLEVALQTEELKDQIRDSYLELEDRVAAALEQIDRNEVEALEQVYNAITQADEDLLAAMREQINEYRQARDNRETEEDIAKKERRLAYMRQDTSGSNKTDILKLEDEIEKARQQYQDKLVDQALTNLQTQQDYAAEQRDKQIALMESQIDWNVKNGIYVSQVAALLEAAFRDDHFLTEDDALWQILYDGEGWGSKSVTALAKIIEEINQLAQVAYYAQQNNSNANKDTSVYNPNTDYMAEMQRAYAAAGGQMTDEVIKLNQMRNQKIADNPELAAKYPPLTVSQLEEELKKWWNNGGKNSYTGTGINSAANDFITDNKGTGGNTNPSTSTPPSSSTPSAPSTTTTTDFTPSVGGYVKVKSGAVFTNGATFSERVRTAGVIDGKPGGFKVLRDGGNGNFYIGRDWTSTGVTGLINKKWLTAYAKGGLVNFTGPAWLDGTPSAPEAVLSAQDTRNFFELRDILRETFDGAASVGRSGDTYQFDIDVNEPKIGSDYDVDQLVARVESDIYDKSVYRNVNAVTRLR